MAVTTLTDVKSFLGITGTDDDTILTTLLSQVQARVEYLAGRKFEAADYIVGLSAGGESVSLPNTPIQNIYGAWIGCQQAIKVTGLTDGDTIRVFSQTTAGGDELVPNIEHSSLNTVQTASPADGLISGMVTAISALSGLTATAEVSSGYAAQLLPGTYQPINGTVYIDAALESVGVLTDKLESGVIKLRSSDGTGAGWPWALHGSNRITQGMGRGARYASYDFPLGNPGLLLAYRGGYESGSIPGDIVLLIHEVIKMIYDERTTDSSLASESLGSYSWSRGQVQSDALIRQRIAAYEVIPIA